MSIECIDLTCNGCLCYIMTAALVGHTGCCLFSWYRSDLGAADCCSHFHNCCRSPLRMLSSESAKIDDSCHENVPALLVSAAGPGCSLIALQCMSRSMQACACGGELRAPEKAYQPVPAIGVGRCNCIHMDNEFQLTQVEQAMACHRLKQSSLACTSEKEQL